MGYMILKRRGKLLVAVGRPDPKAAPVAPAAPAAPVAAVPRAPTAPPAPQAPVAPPPVFRPVPQLTGPPDEPSPAFLQIVETIHTANALAIKALIRRLEDGRELQKTYNLEQAHPQYPGGRMSVINAVDERLSEMGMSHMSPSLDL